MFKRDGKPFIDEDSIEQLEESLKNEDPFVKVFTINTIVDNSKRSKLVPKLNLLLTKESDPTVRARICWALGKIGSERSTPFLINALEDPNAEVRKYAIRAIGEMGSFETISVLIEALKDNNSIVRNEGALVLKELGWEPTNPLEETYSLIARGKWKEIPNIGEQAIIPLLYFVEDDNVEVRINICETLGKIKSERVIQPLFDILMQDPNQHVKENAAKALANTCNPKAVELLILALNAEDWRTRLYAASFLGEMNGKSAISPLINIINSEENQYILKAAKKSLKKLH